MTVVSIHQPKYFTWLGLIDKIAKSDKFVILNNVQYNNRAFQHRTLYSTEGGTKYLSLSVKSKGDQEDRLLIRDAELASQSVPKKHYKTLRHRYGYGKTPGWELIQDRIRNILENPGNSLLDINLRTLKLTMDVYGVSPEIVLASDLSAEGKKTELMLNITKNVGGDMYLSGVGAKDYMKDNMFSREGIDVRYQVFDHPIYKQSHEGEFHEGCFALEWFLEEPDKAKDGFKKHIQSTDGALPPRSIEK